MDGFPPPATIPEAFWAMRGRAIHAYARLEQALCQVFADSMLDPFAGSPAVLVRHDQIASVIFFNIVNTHARSQIMSRLINMRHAGKYSVFWKSAAKGIRKIDDERNKIVHWTAIIQTDLTTTGFGDPRALLKHPTFWSASDDGKEMEENDLNNFIERCHFYSHVLSSFSVVTEPVRQRYFVLDHDAISLWQEIFLWRLDYPLPSGLQLPPNPVKHGIPPRPPS